MGFINDNIAPVEGAQKVLIEETQLVVRDQHIERQLHILGLVVVMSRKRHYLVPLGVGVLGCVCVCGDLYLSHFGRLCGNKVGNCIAKLLTLILDTLVQPHSQTRCKLGKLIAPDAAAAAAAERVSVGYLPGASRERCPLPTFTSWKQH